MNELNTIGSNSIVLDQEAMGRMHSLAQVMAAGVSTVPKHLQGSPADCLAVCMQASQWGMNPYAVAQKTHLVNGTLGYEAQLVNAVVSSSKAIEGRFHYEHKDWVDLNGLTRTGAILKGDKEITWGEWLDTSKVLVKNSPLWKSAPKQQSCYLAVKYWTRLYTPDVLLGVYTPDELDNRTGIKDINESPVSRASNRLRPKAKAKEEVKKEDVPIVSALAAWTDTIDGFVDVVELKRVGGQIQLDENLTDEDKAKLREVYSMKLEELTKGAENADT